jgi:hypothetical protein
VAEAEAEAAAEREAERQLDRVALPDSEMLPEAVTLTAAEAVPPAALTVPVGAPVLLPEAQVDTVALPERDTMEAVGEAEAEAAEEAEGHSEGGPEAELLREPEALPEPELESQAVRLPEGVLLPRAEAE